MSLLQALEEALVQHVSAINARVVVERSRRVITDPLLRTREDRARFLAAVRSTLRLFTSDEKAAEIITDVDRRLTPSGTRVDQERVFYQIVHEDDLRNARAGVRELCLAFAASSGDAQRMATAVSELARNIISYIPGGQLEIDIRRGPPVKITLIAQDQGPGITNLAQILAGSYRSKTGLGRGLLGVKKLMMDVTGVEVIDTSTADRFIRIARSIESLGADCVIREVQPAVAQTLTDLGVSFRGLTMQRNRKRALDFCITRLQNSRRRSVKEGVSQ